MPKQTEIRTLIALDSDLVCELQATLNAAIVELAKSAERERQLKIEIENNRLLTEQQAQEYLQRDYNSLRNYRNQGLSSFKMGQDRWYRKADIDEWLASGYVNRRNRN